MQMTSSQQEMLILVDENDEVIGFQEKESCHDGDGLLHRAFSVFLFDQTGRLLLQKRSQHKRLWGDFWSNSCCSHPRPNEETREAAEKRVREELGVDSCLHFLFKFEYRARYDGRGSENELCHVYAGLLAGEPKVNEFEVSDWRMIWPAVARPRAQLKSQVPLHHGSSRNGRACEAVTGAHIEALLALGNG